MKKIVKPSNELGRLNALNELEIMDTIEEQIYDDLTALASTICDTPIALVSLVGKDRQWFKSHHGLDVRETSRDIAFCSHAILSNELLYIPNSDKDERFKNNPLVKNKPYVKFYAGMPLTVGQDKNIGTLCVIDHKPRTLSEKQISSLKSLARQVESQLNLRLKLKEIKKLEKIKSEKIASSIMIEKTQEAATIGSWQLDLKNNDLNWSKMTYLIHELPVGSKVDVNNAIDFYVDEHKAIIQNYVQGGVKDHKPWDVELQIKTVKGTVKWIRTIGYPVIIDNEVVRLEGTFQDIDSSVKSRQALARAKEKAEEALKYKTQFFANMSHEIRTPLNGIIGLSSVMLQKNLQGELFQQIEHIKSCGDNLLMIINDLLDLSKMEAGKLSVETKEIEIRNLLESVLLIFENMNQNKNIKMNYNLDANVPELIMSDPLRLRQILFNLIGNALKFTDQGEIRIIAKSFIRQEKRYLDFEIQDTGIGISKKDLERLFKKFEQVDTKTSRKYGGTGLGLSICKHLVKILGGRIWAASTPGKGSTFKFFIEYDKVCNKKLLEVNTPGDSSIDEKSVNSKLRVLIVDDNDMNRFVMERFLSKLNYSNVDYCENGQLAVDQVNKEQYDVIFMDVQMPVMDGYEATRMIKKKFGSSVYIVGLSANAFKEDRENALSSGMDCYLEKPLKYHDLVAFLSDLDLKKVA